MSVLELSRRLGVPRRTIMQKMAKLHNKFKINYTIELNEDAFRYINNHFVLLHFKAKPNYSHIKKLLKNSPVPQVAFRVNGTFDMAIYTTALSEKEYLKWDVAMQMALARYRVSWKSSEIVHKQLGFIPLRNERLRALEVPAKYRNILELLNQNSRTSFQEMSKALNMHFNTVAYNFNKIMKEGYIKRFTICMEPHDDFTIMMSIAKYTLSKNFEQDAGKIRQELRSDDPNPLISKYLMCTQLIGSYDFGITGTFDTEEEAYKKQVLFYKRTMKPEDVRLEYGSLRTMLIGKFPVRSVNTAKEYDTIRWTEEL